MAGTTGPSAREASDRTLVRGIAWTGAARGVTQVLSWASTLVVVRLLTPADYGLVGMATLYLGLIRLVSEFGLGSAVLVLRDLTKSQIEQLNSFSLLFGLGGFALAGIAAIPFGAFLHAPALPAVIVASSTVSIISSLRSVPSALMQRDQLFKHLSSIDMARATVGVITVVVLALLGFGYWSLVWNEVLSAAAATGLTIWFRRTGFRWPQLSALRSAMRFSGQVLVSRIAWYSYSNSDFLVAGRILGQAALGAYSLAWTLTNLPIDKVTTLVMTVASTFFSKAREDYAEVRRYLLVLTEGLAAIAFPVSLGLALTADDFVHVVLGDKWAGAVGPLRLLALYASLRSISPLVALALTMTGRVRHTMLNSIWSAIVLPPSFWIGSHWGPTGIAAAWAVVFPFLTIHLYRPLFTEIGLAARDYLRALLPALAGCIALGTAVLGVRIVAGDWLPRSARLATEVSVGIIAYSLLWATLFRPRVVAFRAVIRRARNG